MLRTEHRDSSWIYGALWNKKASSKLQVNIIDTVLFKHVSPKKWLFTTRAGFVKKKRKCNLQELQTHFFRRKHFNRQGFVAVARKRNGDAEVLDEEKFNQFTKNISTTGLSICKASTTRSFFRA